MIWRGTSRMASQRRLEIAVALASKPSMILLDEPTQGMSHADTQETAELIRRLASEFGLSVLLVEHDSRLGDARF